jgi:hypothetical protein
MDADKALPDKDLLQPTDNCSLTTEARRTRRNGGPKTGDGGQQAGTKMGAHKGTKERSYPGAFHFVIPFGCAQGRLWWLRVRISSEETQKGEKGCSSATPGGGRGSPTDSRLPSSSHFPLLWPIIRGRILSNPGAVTGLGGCDKQRGFPLPPGTAVGPRRTRTLAAS